MRACVCVCVCVKGINSLLVTLPLWGIDTSGSVICIALYFYFILFLMWFLYSVYKRGFMFFYKIFAVM